jgi:hypothetical protein
MLLLLLPRTVGCVRIRRPAAVQITPRTDDEWTPIEAGFSTLLMLSASHHVQTKT